MAHDYKIALLAGMILGFFGLVFSLTPYGIEIEEHFGLKLLFGLRGVRPPPDQVVIIGLDPASSEALGLPSNPVKWNRRVHGELVDLLSQKGAAVIVFDVYFGDPNLDEGDAGFSDAIGKAGNVVLCGQIKKQTVSLPGRSDPVYLEKITPPTDCLVKSAAASAPFPLPKIPIRLNQVWLFKGGSEPTLPLVSFNVFAAEGFEGFALAVRKVCGSTLEWLPADGGSISASGNWSEIIASLRTLFEKTPSVSEAIRAENISGQSPGFTGGKLQVIEALIDSYALPDSIYLNFYGPPGTFPTMPLARVLAEPAALNDLPDLKGKAVFIGLSHLDRTDLRDSFNTVFSQPDGTDLSGVEIAATAFSNLLDRSSIKPAPVYIFLSIAFLAGLIIGGVSFSFSMVVSTGFSFGLALIYTALACALFTRHAIWMPLVVPFTVVALPGLLSGLVYKYLQTERQRKSLKKAFGFYLPDTVIHQLTKNVRSSNSLAPMQQTVYGSVIITDGENYTSLAEKMAPDDLARFLNGYYQAMFRPVEEHAGTVSNVVGDSMLAVWAGNSPSEDLRRNACLAALGIVGDIEIFNSGTGSEKLYTRIGLHFGQLVLGNLGGIGHYEYRPVGDVVNTASRIENLNKTLGTRLLVSEPVIKELPDFLARELGSFVFKGKENPVRIYELICLIERATKAQKNLCSIFSDALNAFVRCSWDEAEGLFSKSLQILVKDGPSNFYLKKCREYRNSPPMAVWDGVLHLQK